MRVSMTKSDFAYLAGESTRVSILYKSQGKVVTSAFGYPFNEIMFVAHNIEWSGLINNIYLLDRVIGIRSRHTLDKIMYRNHDEMGDNL